jgi:pyrroloquinoline quinone biosynthesis protein D
VNVLSGDELEARLRDIGARRYHRLHPFHKLLHGGACSKGQVQAWALNRYYYQAMIPIKDASLIARCEDSATRREWRSRLVDHDGTREGEGGIARWLKLTGGLGLDRDYVMSLRGLLPATRFAVDAYVRFVREKTLLEAIASSLTELFSPVIIGERMEGMLKNYDFVNAETLAYFSQRPPQAERDSRFALDYVKQHARTPETQAQVLAALEFKCDILWAMLDALYHAYVAPKLVPPGAFVPTDQEASMNDTPEAIAPEARPRLPRGVRLMHNDAQDGWVLLAPERVFKADAIAVTVVQMCTGDATFAEIVDDLAAKYAAPRERILADVTTLLRGLADKRLLEL